MRAQAALLKKQYGGTLKETIPNDLSEKYHRNWIKSAHLVDSSYLLKGNNKCDVNSNTKLWSTVITNASSTTAHTTPQEFTGMIVAYGLIPTEKIINAALNARHTRYIKLLMESRIRIDVQIPPHQRSMVHLACLNCDLDKIDFLISQGANVNILDQNQQTPLHLAIQLSNPEKSAQITRRLLSIPSLNVNIKDSKGSTPLHYACIVNNAAIVNQLLERGAYMDIADNKANIPLHYAKGEVYRLLIEIRIELRKKTHYNQAVAKMKAREFVSALFMEFTESCRVCKRTFLKCRQNKLNNYRHWLLTHGRLKNEIESNKADRNGY